VKRREREGGKEREVEVKRQRWKTCLRTEQHDQLYHRTAGFHTHQTWRKRGGEKDREREKGGGERGHGEREREGENESFN
jgi:hypothetical protein